MSLGKAKSFIGKIDIILNFLIIGFVLVEDYDVFWVLRCSLVKDVWKSEDISLCSENVS